MKLFECQSCGHRLGYLPDLQLLSALEPKGGYRWHALATPGTEWVLCANAAAAMPASGW